MTSTTNRGAATALRERMAAFCREVRQAAQEMDEADETLLPEEEKLPLLTPRALGLWARLQRAGLVDEALQPTVSRAMAAVMADLMGEVLGLERQWKAFETLWQRRNMKADLCKALKQQQYPLMEKKMRLIIAGDKRRN